MPRPEAERRYTFRPAGEADLPMLGRWLAEPHAAAWWGGGPDEGLAEIRQAMREPWVEPQIASLDGAPLAYIQSYDIHAEEDHPYRDQPLGTIGVDVTIGPPELVGAGHGSALLRQFVDGLLARGVPRVVIDPDPANARAVRAYEKAGFRALGERHSIYGHALLMARDREEEAVAEDYSFRPVTADDLPTLHEWLSKPHVVEWWGDPDEQLALIEADIGAPAMRLWIVSLREKPFAYVQSWDPHAYHALADQPAGTRGVDPFIGPPEMLGRGHGSRFLRLFAQRLLDEGASRVVIDPEEGNLRAVRAYEKAGFRAIDRRILDDGPALLMQFAPAAGFSA